MLPEFIVDRTAEVGDLENLVVDVAGEDVAPAVGNEIEEGIALGVRTGNLPEALEIIGIKAFIRGDIVVVSGILNDIVNLEALELVGTEKEIGRLPGMQRRRRNNDGQDGREKRFSQYTFMNDWPVKVRKRMWMASSLPGSVQIAACRCLLISA